MIVEYIRYRIDDADRPAFESAYQRAGRVLATAPECVDYELTRCPDEPACYVLRITWISAKAHLEGFRQSSRFGPFLAEIKAYVPAIEEMRHYEPVGVQGKGSATPTLYEWAGGAAAFERLTEAFYAKVREDDVLEPVFRGVDPAHPKHVAAWLAEVFGGPSAYSEAHGGHRHMVTRHLGRAITERQRRRWISLLLDTADEIGLPGDPEFRAAFVGYLEWGTRMARMLSQPGVQPPGESPMPVWGWGEAPPYQPT